MYKAIKDNKIIAISDTESKLLSLVKDEVVEDTEHTSSDYAQYNGEYLLKSEIPTPSHEEQSAKRRAEYVEKKDPITCAIQSLRDEEQTEEVKAEIDALIAERKEIVAEIQAKYPYPVEENKEE